jgi:DNA-binding MarR family transcriptional regulator
METDFQLDPVLDFMRLLWEIEHRLQGTSKRMRAQLGITGPQRLVLRIVHRFPAVSAGELALILHLHPSTITGIVQRLVHRGLLERTADPADSRRVRLRLKPAGRAYTRATRGTVERAVSDALVRAGAANVERARKVLAEIARALPGSG